MAIYDEFENNQIKDTDGWENKTGKQVEDYICRNFITGGEYDKDEEVLILKKADGTSLEGIPISVQTPSYIYGLILYGIRIDEKNIYSAQEYENLLMQYKDGRKIELGVAIYSVAQRSQQISTVNKLINLEVALTASSGTESIQIGTLEKSIYPTNHQYFKGSGDKLYLDIPDNVDISDVVTWVDVTTLFIKSFKNGEFKASFKQVEGTSTQTYNATLGMSITNEILNLKYTGSVISTAPSISVSFEDFNVNPSEYTLVGYINNTRIDNKQSGDFTIQFSKGGLYKCVVKAEHVNDRNISTDWLKFDVIYTPTDFSGTEIAINGVNRYITNNGVATLYELVAYSSQKQKITINTYLNDGRPDTTIPKWKEKLTLVKQETLSYTSYNDECHTQPVSYKKYIELKSVGTKQYLLVEVINDNTGESKFYEFNTVYFSSQSNNYLMITEQYQELEVEPCINEYTYIDTYNISKNFDQIVGQANKVFITHNQSSEKATLIQDLETSDGWHESQGLTYLKLSKQGKSVLKNPIELNLGDSFTIEMKFKTYNISDKTKTILTIGNLGLYPTQIAWIYDDTTSAQFLKRCSQFQENKDTHVVITVTKNWKLDKNNPYYPNYMGTSQNNFDQAAALYTLNLVRIYINGVIDREIVLEDAELDTLKKSALEIYPKSADIDIYLFRVYNQNALNHKEVIRNYISALPSKDSKQSVYTKNDISLNGKISWTKCLGKQNTLLFIYHNGGRFPNRFWGKQDNDESANDVNKKNPCTLVINYADAQTNARHGGILDKLQCKGQGSSAMRYLIWNVNSSLNKFSYKDESGETKKVKSTFRPFGKLWQNENRVDLLPPNMKETFDDYEKYYPMPTYDGEKDTTDYKYTKMVGKVNWASSMQSHKIGACKLYDDAYKSSFGTASLPSGGKKAVHEEPFMYFYIETDEPFNSDFSSNFDVNSLTYDKILELGSKAEFMGFQTWGPGKGDDACSGFDEDLTPQYLMLEGGENSEPSVNFQRPWQTLQRLRTDFIRDGRTYSYNQDLNKFPTVNKSESINEPWKQLLIDGESIVYTDRKAWDVDYGLIEVEVGDTTYYDFSNGAKESLKYFREFYDHVYKYDFTYETLPSNITKIDSSDITLNKNKKYQVLSSTLTIDNKSITQHKSGDLYRYDEPSKTWVSAGVYYDNGWERLNYFEDYRQETGESISNNTIIKSYLQNKFKEAVNKFVKVNDIAFHQALIKFLLATDNRAKNTYFQIIGDIMEKDSDGSLRNSNKGDHLIRLIGDDLDTILATDNAGLQSKLYNIIEDSYNQDFDSYWGDSGNLFFRMFDLTYEDDIQSQLTKIIQTAGISSDYVNNTDTYFYKTFFKVQEDFPAIAYNDTATIYYETAHVIKNCGASYSFEYTNNGMVPIEQSHGSCLESERQFVKERMAFLAGYAKSGLGDNNLTTSGVGGNAVTVHLYLKYKPSQDFYPTYAEEANVYRNMDHNLDSDYDIIKYQAVKDTEYEQNVTITAINQSLNQVNLYKEISLIGMLTQEINNTFNSAVKFTIDGSLLESLQFFSSLSEEDKNRCRTITFNAKLPVVEELNLIKLNLGEKLDLSKYTKLQKLNLSESTIKSIEFPQTSVFKQSVLPSSIETLEIINNPGLQSIDFEGLNNLKTVYIDCAKCGEFDVSEFCEQLIDCANLKSVELLNANLSISEEAILKLIRVKNCSINGVINIITDNEELKDISFDTKKLLVEKFGDIDSGLKLKINYQVSSISEFSVNEECYIYMPNNSTSTNHSSDIFNVSIPNGNNIEIKDNILHIEYTWYSSIDSKIAELDLNTGTITQYKDSDVEGKIKITLYLNNGASLYKITTVKFQWVAPEVGNYAYIDGTFSDYYNSKKTLVGMVYAKKQDDATSGKVYIIGKEYAYDEPLYLGYEEKNVTTDWSSEDTDDKVKEAYYTNGYATALLGDAYNSFTTVQKLSTYNVFGNITSITHETVLPDPNTFKGKEDTKIYIDNVNNNVLPKLDSRSNFQNDITKEIVDGSNTYSINSTSNLKSILTKFKTEEYNLLDNNNLLESTNMYSSLIYPYFYSMYLYEPAPKENETIDTQYTKNNWYAPSIGELTHVLYLRGYSVDEKFTMNQVRGTINTKNSTLSPTPIFSKALSDGYENTYWNTLNGTVVESNEGGINNIATTFNYSTKNNYSYISYLVKRWEGSAYKSYYYTKWVSGKYENNYDYDEDPEGKNASRLIKHQGIPFVTYNYKKPQL